MPNFTQPSPASPCPCCSGSTFSNCCQEFILEQSVPETAEQLMRSRYTAFATGNTSYLVTTHHPRTRDSELANGIEETIRSTLWLGLTILETSNGQKKDKKGTVTFRADYRHGAETGFHQERSRFEKLNGKWHYLDGRVS